METPYESLIGPVISEEKTFEECVRQKTTDDDRRTEDGACLYYKLNFEPKDLGEL